MTSFTLCHTADWHLGHALSGRSRELEHAEFLRWLVELVVERSIDVLAIAGDVFDTASPSGAAQAMFYEFLAQLGRRAPSTRAVVIAGNHDSPARLAAPDPIVASLGTRIVGGVSWRDGAIDVERLIVPVHRGDRLLAQVVAVPFLRACDLPPSHDDARELDPARRHVERVRRVYREVGDAARAKLADDAALIVLGHCHVAGAAMSEHSERSTLGGLAGALAAEVFPDPADYVALGHLHLAQSIGGREHVRNAGSPTPLAFGEEGYRHEVRIARFESGRLVAQEGVPVPRSVAMLRVPHGEPAVLSEVLRALEALELDDTRPRERWPGLEVRVRLDRPEPALRAQIDRAPAGRAVRLVKVSCDYPEREREQPEASRLGGRSNAALDVRGVFARRWEKEHASAPPADVLAALEEALAVASLDDDARQELEVP